MEDLWPDECDEHEVEEVEEEEYADDGSGADYDGEALHDVLPLEVMQHIMGLLNPASVGRAECVCRAWRVACHSPFVWEAVYRRHFASRPSGDAQEAWRKRCVQAARSLRQKSQTCKSAEDRAWEIVKWSCACGFDRVLEEFLRVEGAIVTLDMLNGYPPGCATDPAFADVADRTRPIHLAAARGSADVVEILALAGAYVNASDARGNTAVGIAAAKGHLDAVEVLLRHGAGGEDFAKLVESQKGNRRGARPLSFQAAAGGHIKIMEVLLDKAGGVEQARAMVNAVEARTGKTALHYAAENGRCEMMKLLLRQGADKDSLNLTKQSPIHLATLASNVAAVQLLLEQGAKLVFSAAEAKLKKQPASPMHLAAGNQDEALVSLFLEHGISINLTDETGRTPLHFALRSSKKSMWFLCFLLKHGADATAVDQSGQGALHSALKSLPYSTKSSEAVEICKCLIEAGADVHLKDPILVRLSNTRTSNSAGDIMELIDLFIEHGVDVREHRIGTPLLRVAASRLGIDLLEAMLDRGMDPNGADGSTEELPLHTALRTHPYYVSSDDKDQVIELLLKRGADVNRPSGPDVSPPLLSVPYNNMLYLDLLLSRGADINAKNGSGETLLYRVACAWPWDDDHLDSLKDWALALIKRGADPSQCLDGDQAPQAEADENHENPLSSRWVSFLRSVGIPLRPAEEAEEEGEDEQTEQGSGAAEDSCHTDDDDEGEEKDEEDASPC